jgi:hypothetical protein
MKRMDNRMNISPSPAIIQILKQRRTYCTARLKTEKLCILPTECICVFRTVLTLNSINRLGFAAEA